MVSKLLSGKALDEARAWHALQKELNERREVIQTRANLEWAAVQEEIGTESDEVFGKLCDLVGIEEKGRHAWALVDLFIDEHGIALLVLDERKTQQRAVMNV